jgi:hypothetical protein
MRRLAGFISGAGLVFCVACGQTDSGITTAVKTKLAADDTVKAYQVDVDTNNHVVTLKGDVETSAAKDRAVEIARNTDGVNDVIDQLTVRDIAATSGRLEDDTEHAAGDINADAHAAATSTTATIKRGAENTENGAEKAADKTADAAKKAADKTVDTTKKVGNKVKGVFTDDDKDSDNDGH